MRILVTGSSGHLGEALVRTLRNLGHEPLGIDILPSPFTGVVGSIAERDRVRDCMTGIEAVLHAATLHKPHVASHSRQAFVDTNITGTLNLLEASVAAGVSRFIFTSTTSAFGDALTPPAGAPAAWITEDVTPAPKNIYGVTKTAAENLCELFHRNEQLPCLVLRTSRFFPEEDDNPLTSSGYALANAQVNELLYRRVDIDDVVGAHLCALDRAPAIGFGRFIVSATTPFTPEDLPALRADTPAVVARLFPAFAAEFRRRQWTMFPAIDRVYVNTRAREALGWQPSRDFATALADLQAGRDPRSDLARTVGSKGYHPVSAAAPHPQGGSV